MIPRLSTSCSLSFYFFVDRLNNLAPAQNSSCSLEFMEKAGEEIKSIVVAIVSDLEYYQRDYVFLLHDKTDMYVNSNQKWPVTFWAAANPVQRMDLLTRFMETYIFNFYRDMFEVSVEEIIIEMHRFNSLIETTRRTTFEALANVAKRLEKKLNSC